MQDAWRAYLELALGLTEASKKKAKQVGKELVGKGGATATQVQSFVDELLTTSRSNREGIARLVRYEVDRALGAMGLATAEEVTDLSTRVQTLERQLREASVRAAGAGAAGTGSSISAGQPTATKTVAKKTVAKKTVAKRAAAKQPAAKKAAGKKTAAKRTAAKKSPTG